MLIQGGPVSIDVVNQHHFYADLDPTLNFFYADQDPVLDSRSGSGSESYPKFYTCWKI
jgi:hypothetical protein